MNPLNPGVKTSEFKIVVLGIISVLTTALVLGGYLSQADANNLTVEIGRVVDGIIAFTAIAGMAVSFVNGRNLLKVKHLETQGGTVTPPVVQQVVETQNVVVPQGAEVSVTAVESPVEGQTLQQVVGLQQNAAGAVN